MTDALSSPTAITIYPDALRQGNYKSRAPEVPQADADFWGKDGFSFGDLIDIVNPLQHIPVVSSLYRAITGDEISTGSRLIGGGLLSGGLIGGTLGFMMEVGNTVMAQETGKDLTQTALSLFTGGGKEEEKPQEVKLARADIPAPKGAYILGQANALPAALPEAVAATLAQASGAQKAAEALAQTPAPLPLSEVAREKNRDQIPAYNQYKRTQMLDKMNQRILNTTL